MTIDFKLNRRDKKIHQEGIEILNMHPNTLKNSTLLKKLLIRSKTTDILITTEW